jgi:pteridine reductase
MMGRAPVSTPIIRPTTLFQYACDMPTLQEVFRCDRPVALVTGSGSPRVGRAIAGRLAQLGCRLALHANTSIEQAEQAAEEIRQTHPTEVIVTEGSLADEEVPAKMVAQTYAQFGRIDILVNSAAIWAPQTLESVTAEELRRYFDVNTLGSFLCAQQAGLRMVEQTWGGSIVNLGDWATVRPYLDHAAYFPSKGAIETMTRSLAVELASRNRRIRVNCVQPGPVLLAADVSDEVQAKIAQSTLLGRIGSPHHVAHAVQFLCENDFVTGVCLAVDGGRSIYAPDGLQVGLNSG